MDAAWTRTTTSSPVATGTPTSSSLSTRSGRPYLSWTIAFIEVGMAATVVSERSWLSSHFFRLSLSRFAVMPVAPGTRALKGRLLETFDQQPDGQRQLEEESGHREIEADMNTEQFGDGPATCSG